MDRRHFLASLFALPAVLVAAAKAGAATGAVFLGVVEAQRRGEVWWSRHGYAAARERGFAVGPDSHWLEVSIDGGAHIRGLPDLSGVADMRRVSGND